MRITNGMMITSSLANLNGALTRVSKYNNQLASNRKILTLSDSPVGVLNSMGARAQIRRLEQYQRNVDASRSWIQQAESSVTEMEELTISIRELLTDSMGTENAEDKAIFATQLRQYTESLLELCNASNGSQYMFGGYNVTQQPFVAERDDQGRIIGVKYNGLDLTGLGVRPSTELGKLDKLDVGGTTVAQDIAWSGNMTANGTYKVNVEAKTVTKTDKDGNAILDDNGQPVSEEVLEFTFRQVADDQYAADGKTQLYPEVTGTPLPEYKATVSVTDALKDYNGAATKITLDLKATNTEDGSEAGFGTISLTVPKDLQDRATLTNDITAELQKALENTQGTSAPANASMGDIVSSGTTYAQGVTWAGPSDVKGSYSASMAGNKVTFEDADGNSYPIDIDVRAAIDAAASNIRGAGATYDKDAALGISIPLTYTNNTDPDNPKVMSFGTIQMEIPAGLTDGATPPGSLSAAQIEGQVQTGLSTITWPNFESSPTVISSESVHNAAATTGTKAAAGLQWTGTIRDTTQKYDISVIKNEDGNATGIALSNSFGSVMQPTISLSDIQETSLPELLADSTKSDPAPALKFTDKDGKEVSVQNKRYTLDLSASGYGKVTWTTQDMIDYAIKIADPKTTEESAKVIDDITKRLADGTYPSANDLANFVASAEYVTSNIGSEATQHIKFEVGHNIMTDVTFTGIELVGTGEENLFKIMIDLADMLDNNARNEDLTVYITKLTKKQDDLLTAMVKSGNRDNKMTTMVNRYKLDAINHEANRSNIEDIDQAEVIMQMKYSEAIYKQALAASAQIIQPTLMDFLR